MNPTIQTSDGHYFNLLEPCPTTISIKGIAHALSNLCRFTGHPSEFYSVAQHSVMVSLVVPPEVAREALLHDAAEAYIGDVSTPLKMLLPEYKAIERNIEQVIAERFKLNWAPMTQTLVKKADLILLATEKRDLFVSVEREPKWACLDGISPLDMIIRPWPPEKARRAFLQRTADLRLM